ncbi:MAG: 2-hydroxyacid dehydrogenase [Candidatus Obscuribacterales bacterium]|nr:2-hydroxyacid dehydrogenase [Candidatus Obscuribacterales bacterium]
MLKILLCNDSYPPVVERLRTLLPEHEILCCHPSATEDSLDGVDVVIPSVAQINERVLERGSFGLVNQLGVGLDNVDIEVATRCGVWVARVPGAGSGNAESVAELAVMFMLALCRRYLEARNNLENSIFFKPSGRSLLGKTVCVIGFGDIGIELARRLIPFGVQIKAVRRRPQLPTPSDIQATMYGMDNLQEALADSDYVVLALPETNENKNIINRQSIKLVKPGAYLINVARGGLVDLDALNEALQSGHIAGAGLDVFVEEPTDPTHPIFKQNVLATPHIGGNTDASYLGITAAIAENVRRFERGETPLNVVNSLTTPHRKGNRLTAEQPS